MKDLFDMMAGTSTGSILSTGLSIKKEGTVDEPKLWGEDCRNIYIDQAPFIFKQNGVGVFFQIVCYLIFIFAFGGIF